MSNWKNLPATPGEFIAMYGDPFLVSFGEEQEVLSALRAKAGAPGADVEWVRLYVQAENLINKKEVDLDNLPATAAEFEEMYGTEPTFKEGEDKKALLAFAAKVEKDCSWEGLYVWVKTMIHEKKQAKEAGESDDDSDDSDDYDDDRQITQFNDLLYQVPQSDSLFLKLDKHFTDVTATSSHADLEQYIQMSDYPVASDNSKVQNTYARNMEMIIDAVHEGDQDALDVWDVAAAAKAVISIHRQQHAAKVAKLKAENTILKRKLADKDESDQKRQAVEAQLPVTISN